MGATSIPFFRWMDDMRAICESFSEARRTHDAIERHLYEMGMTLNGERTRILKAATAIARLEPARVRFERKRDEMIEGAAKAMGDYGDEGWLPDPDEMLPVR